MWFIRKDTRCSKHSFTHKYACQICPKSDSLFPKIQKPHISQLLCDVEHNVTSMNSCQPLPLVNIPKVNFMSEWVSLKTTDGQEVEALVSYDSHSGISLIENINQHCNFGPVGQMSEMFFMNTVPEKRIEYQLPAAQLKIVTKKGRTFSPTVFQSTFPSSTNHVQIPAYLLKEHQIEPPPVASDDCVRVLIGEDYSVWHPIKVKMPAKMRKLYPHLSLSRSQLSSKLILRLLRITGF